MRVRTLAVLILAVVLSASACGTEDPQQAAEEAVDAAESALEEVDASDVGAAVEAASEALADAVTFTADLSGDAEVPGPGDPSAAGEATVEISPEGELCATITTDLDDATAAHIHRGTADESGDVVVDLSDALGGPQTCVDVDPTLLAEIVADPDGFYVNVHTPDFPDGAVRGQLSR